MTFSIVAREGAQFGVAVASKFLSVGAVVPAARAGVGAVATQSFARVAYLDELLDALAAGSDGSSALAHFTAADDGRETRQVGVVDGRGGAASFTGSECMAWAGGRTGSVGAASYAIQGNILVGPQVLDAMETAWLASAGLAFDARLVAALLAGDAAGGDARGRQSAALYAVAPGAGYDRCGVLADLRVDDHPQAAAELARIHALHQLYFGAPEDVAPLTGALADEVRARLDRLGHTGSDLDVVLADWMGEVNLETRLSPGGIDARVLAELRSATGP